MFPRAAWRLLNTGYADGYTNMAIDEAILLTLVEGRAPPTLRFYGWEPPCLSIGYSQSMEKEADVELCRRHGIDCVRRPTGGRAILHIDELTYSVIAPLGEPRVAGEVVESYRRLSLGLASGLNLLGAEVTQALPERKGSGGRTAACFDAPSHYEITAGGKKLVGSAQMRRRGAVLQHGSLPLEGDITRIVSYLKVHSEEKTKLRRELAGRATTLEHVLGRVVPFTEAAAVLAEGFARALNLELVPGELSEHEKEMAERLRREKYATDEWNLRR